jgi:hypothetical protein
MLLHYFQVAGVLSKDGTYDSQIYLGSIIKVYEFQLIDCVVGSLYDHLCGLVVRVLGYRSGGPGSILGTTRKKSSGSGTGSTQPREYN